MESKVYVEVGSIRLEEETDTPIMLLQQPNTNKVLPIWIGTIEAVSIAYAQEGFVHPRPQTHDLLVNIIESLDSKIIEYINNYENYSWSFVFLLTLIYVYFSYLIIEKSKK